MWGGDDKEKEKLLANCYQNSLQLAQEKGLEEISFPSISTGVYRFPIKQAAQIAIKTIADFFQNNKESFNVTMVLFSEQDLQAYEKALQQIK